MRQPDHPRKLGEAVSPWRWNRFDKREDARKLRGPRAAEPGWRAWAPGDAPPGAG